MNEALRAERLEMLAGDQRVRQVLLERGELFDGYDEEMAAVHAANAVRLARIADRYDWPGRTLVGTDGS